MVTLSPTLGLLVPCPGDSRSICKDIFDEEYDRREAGIDDDGIKVNGVHLLIRLRLEKDLMAGTQTWTWRGSKVERV
jgi:hypothetical protein